MLSKELEITLNLAFKSASDNKHEFMTVEHLLRALLDNETASNILKSCGCDLAALRSLLDDFIQSTTPITNGSESKAETQATLGFQRVLQRAVFHVQSSGKQEVTGANVLVAIFSEQESQAVYFLKQQNIARLDIVNFITHGISKTPQGEDYEQENQERDGGDGPNTQNNPLVEFSTNLNERAELGKIDPLIGREKEVNRVVQILSRRRKNNPLLVGDSGVGKTAVAEGLARLIIEGRVPEVLSKSIIFSLDLGALLALSLIHI